MLHQLLSLERPLIVYDVEATGTDTQQDRIVEMAFQIFEPEKGMTAEWRSLINPGIPIPPSASEVHHITDDMVRGCKMCQELGFIQAKEGHEIRFDADHMLHDFAPWPYFKQVAARIASGFSNCDFAGKRVRFDIQMTAAEMRRANVEWSIAGARIIDADRLEQLGDPRSLSHLVKKHLDEDMGSQAHSALADVQWTSRLIAAQIKAYQTLPRTLDALHDLQFPGMIDLDGKFKFVNGVPCFAQWGKHANKPMYAVPIDYYDFICNADFSAEVKDIARAAKLGKYPEKK